MVWFHFDSWQARGFIYMTKEGVTELGRKRKLVQNEAPIHFTVMAASCQNWNFLV